MTTPLRQKDPLRITGSWATPLAAVGAVDILDGRIDGDFVSLALAAPDWTLEVDGSGGATRVFSNNKSGSLTITLSASSPTNTMLSTAVNLDRQTKSVIGLLLLRDANGGTTIKLSNAFLQGHPSTITMGTSRGDRQWTFMFSHAEIVLVGHDIVGA